MLSHFQYLKAKEEQRQRRDKIGKMNMNGCSKTFANQAKLLSNNYFLYTRL